MNSRFLINDELVLYGDVGDMWGDGSGFTATDVLSALSEIGPRDLTVRLNSGGGYAFDGVAIYNALVAHPGKITVSVDAIAASAASVIAMAGNKIVMRPGAMLMIHDPSTVTWGTAEDHRKTAASLDMLSTQAASIYARKSKKSMKAIKAMMTAETWLDGEGAVAAGLATENDNCDCELDDNGDCNCDEMSADDNGNGDDIIKKIIPKTTSAAVAISKFDYAVYQKTPPKIQRAGNRPLPTGATQEGTKTMTKPAVAANPAVVDQTPATVTATMHTTSTVPTVTNPAGATLVAANDDTAMRLATMEIFHRATMAGLSRTDADALSKDPKHGGNMVNALQMIIDKVSMRDPDQRGQNLPNGGIGHNGGPSIQMGMDERTKFSAGVEKALLAKTNMKGGEHNEFTGYSLVEIARMSLEKIGIRAPHDRMQMITTAFNPRQMGYNFQPLMDFSSGHSTSDFANILANVANKSMLKGWEEAEETYSKWTASGTLTDFKTAKRLDLNLFPALTIVPEGASYQHATITDRGVNVALATYGKLFSITRQAIINDDLSVFSKVPGRMGRASNRTIGNLVYAILTANAAMAADGVALFHATHRNLAGTNAIPSVTSFSSARTAMGKQLDPDSLATGGLNIRPAYGLFPLELEMAARGLMLAEYDPAATTLAAPNTVRGMVEVISDARLSTASATAWYLAANPNVVDTIEVSYLNGVQAPIMEQELGFEIDGITFKIRIDAGVTPLDFRGLYKNAGV